MSHKNTYIGTHTYNTNIYVEDAENNNNNNNNLR